MSFNQTKFIGCIFRNGMRFITKVKIENHDVLRENEPFILASNHISYFDSPIILSHINMYVQIPVIPVATIGLFRFPLSIVMQVVEAIPINRGINNKNVANIKKILHTLDCGRSILIFPEGGVNRSNLMGPFHKGIGMLALKSNATVIPMFITGSQQISLPKKYWFQRTIVTIRIGNPIRSTQYGCHKDAYKEITSNIRKEMDNLAGKE